MAQTFAVGQAPWETQAASSGTFAVGKAPWETPQASTSPPAPIADGIPGASVGSTPSGTIDPTFPASPTDNPFVGSLKLLGNMPSSALNFARNTFNFLNPINTIKTAQDIGTSAGQGLNDGMSPADLALGTVKELPHAAYQTLVPQFIQHIVGGNYQDAADLLRNDPVGQLAPLIMIGRQAAEATGKGAAFDKAMSAAVSPITKLPAKAIELTGNLGSQALGSATGAGASSIREAFNGSQAFTDAMRGNIDPEEVVQTAQDAVANIAEARRTTYQADLATLGENTKALDISPVINTLHTQLGKFGVTVGSDGALDFSRSSIANNGSARADIQGVYDNIKDWGSKPGDRTPLGMDILKKQLSDFYSQSGSARAFVQAVKGNVSSILKDQVPGYADMTAKYARASQLLDDIKSATGAGGNAKVDTVFTKLSTAMKADKELRLEVMNEMQSQGAQPDLMAKIAGVNMQRLFPKGLSGKLDIGAGLAVLTHFVSPEFALALLTTSPRIVGEFVRALGLSAEKTAAIMSVVNKIGGKLPTAALGSVPQSNQPQTPPQGQ